MHSSSRIQRIMRHVSTAPAGASGPQGLLEAVTRAAPSVSFLKQAVASPGTGAWSPGGTDAGEDGAKTQQLVAGMLARVAEGRETAVLELAREFDGLAADARTVVVAQDEIAAAAGLLTPQLKADLAFQHARVTAFARAQLASYHSFESELYPGVFTGQKVTPCDSAGCYIPGGRYSHVSSATMSIATAKAAGVRHVVAASPPERATGRIHPGTLYAMQQAGADTILCLGGVQAIGALAAGCFTGHPADIIVGPGNKWVAEAKRQLFGQVGIDMFAGPTEVLILADGTADPAMVAVDLVGQAEHGPTSPAWLFTTSEALARRVIDVEVPRLLAAMPAGSAARDAWRDYGEVAVVADRAQMAALSDHYAAEHLEVHAADLPWWLETLRNYGSLFLGEEAHTSLGDKCSGPNHILPTKRVSRYSGGLSVDKFLRKLTYQRMNREACREMQAAGARISRLEGMEGHARSCDARLHKYFPGEKFDLDIK